MSASAPRAIPPMEYALCARSDHWDCVVAPQTPITWTASATIRMASATPVQRAHRRVRATANPLITRSTANAIHGHGDGPGTHSTTPFAVRLRPDSRRRIANRWTTCLAPGSRCTAGGSLVPIQCARWSCQRAVVDDEILRHTGAAFASAIAGIFWGIVVEVRLRYVAGDRVFSNTPCGPTRR